MSKIEREHIMNYVFEFSIKSDLDGVFMEFGCGGGNSLISAYKAYSYWLAKACSMGRVAKKRKLYAFDSFHGLPELENGDRLTGYGVFKRGQYSFSQKQVEAALRKGGVNLDDLVIVSGFYEDSLGPLTAQMIGDQMATVIHIDCDLYSSAVRVMEFVTPFIQDGTILVFDDFYCYRGNPGFGVRRAFEEWRESEKMLTTEYLRYSWAGCAFIVNLTDSDENNGD